MEDKKHKFAYNWTLKNAIFTKNKGSVFSCFACGGGSSMGYKLAGFDVIGCNEIDFKIMAAYKINLNPQYSYLEPIQTFKLRNDLPKALYTLDILDGSPPCSSFSMAGKREKDWSKKKKFREGQTKQILDTLFFDFIDLTKKLQPKVVIAENVKGILLGNAIKYSGEIIKQFNQAGYYTQYWLLNASTMGVPQRRERVFFIGLRKDLAKPFLYQKDLFTIMPNLNLLFNEKEIPFNKIQKLAKRENLNNGYLKHWKNADYTGRAKAKSGNTFGFFYKTINGLICATLTSSGVYAIENEPKLFTNIELSKVGSYPLDYSFGKNKPIYLIGMSVPPVMIAQIATKIYEQWLSKLN